MSFKFKAEYNGTVYEVFEHTEEYYMLQYYVDKKPHFFTHSKKSIGDGIENKVFMLVKE